MLDILRCSIRNLGRKKMRTFLTVAGIAIGVASVVIIGNISECGSSAISTELESLGIDGITVTTTLDASAPELAEKELELIRSVKNVDQAMPLIVQTTEIYARGTQMEALIWGVDSRASRVISLQAVFGRYINNRDVSSQSNVCMIDQNYARSIYHRDNIIGKKISILCGGLVEEFEVIGIIKTGSGLLENLIGEYIPNFVYVPYTTLQRMSGKQSFDQVAVRIEEGKDADKIGEELVNTLSRANNSQGYVASNLAKQKEGLYNLLNIVTVVLSAVGAISLLVASLSIMTVMLVSVNERTREIGIKKSIGARRSTILVEFLLEAVLISIFGCFIGVIAGTGISYAGAGLVGMTLQIRTDIMLIAVLFSLFTGIIFGVYPAAKASNLRPVDALRLE